MKFAYADPPYLGCCDRYDHYHPDGLCWDDLETHRLLIERLQREFPDGWALSMASTNLRDGPRGERDDRKPNGVDADLSLFSKGGKPQREK